MEKFTRAERLLNEGETAAALEIYKTIGEDSASPAYQIKALRKTAEVYGLIVKDYPQSLQFYQKIIVRFKNKSDFADDVLESVRKVGEIYLTRKKDLSTAVVEYEKAIQDAGALNTAQKVELRCLVANAYFQFDDFQQARIEAMRVLHSDDKKNRFYEEAVVIVARSYFLERRFTDAKQFLDANISAIRTPSENIEAQFLLAQICEELGAFDEALAILTRIRERYPNRKVIEYGIKKVMDRKNNAKKAW